MTAKLHIYGASLTFMYQITTTKFKDADPNVGLTRMHNSAGFVERWKKMGCTLNSRGG